MLHEINHLYLFQGNLKFLIVNVNLVAHICANAAKLFNFLLLWLLLVPIWVFAAANILLILFSKWVSYCFFHLLISSSATDVRLKSFALYTFLVVFQDSFCFQPKLVFVIVLKMIFWRLGILSFDWKDLIAAIFHSN